MTLRCGSLGEAEVVQRLPECLGLDIDVVFDLWHLGTRWTDRFLPSELVPA